VPLVRFANGAEHREARQCVQVERSQQKLTFARTAVLPAQRRMTTYGFALTCLSDTIGAFANSITRSTMQKIFFIV
ncbi:MAG: hypothetical protein HYR76_09330, partial [Ignavibacteria bacterium]|nr:hypothetical protein [Ignavibacteria bacterium]